MAKEKFFGKLADPGELNFFIPASDRILDDACTLLAALRSGVSIEYFNLLSIPANILNQLLKCAGMLDTQDKPNTEKTRLFLEAPRTQALTQLASVWMNSNQFNELALMPDLVCEGKWKNDPLQSRQTLLDLIRKLPHGQWWHLQSFIQDMQSRMPDFLRPSGDYDSWFVRERKSGDYLRGFNNWEKVEGKLVSFVITGPLHWLGITDLASRNAEEPACAFRLSAWSEDMLNRRIPKGLAEEKEKVTVQSNGKLSVPRLTSRAARYQISRFCDWQGVKDDFYRFRITARGLQRAKSQKLLVRQFITVLHKYGKPPIAPTLLQALNRWEKHHLEARMEKGILLRVKDPAILDQLANSRAKRFILDRPKPTLMVIKAGGEDVIQHALTELGYLSEISATL